MTSDTRDEPEGRRVKLRRTLVVLLMCGCGVWGLQSCKDSNPTGPGGSPSTIVFPDSNVSYSAHVQPLFDQACAFAGCHDDGSNQSPLILSRSGNNVRIIPGIAVPGNPDASTLVLRIQGSVGQRMPPNGNPLNQNQIAGIRAWIKEGARQDN